MGAARSVNCMTAGTEAANLSRQMGIFVFLYKSPEDFGTQPGSKSGPHVWTILSGLGGFGES